MGWIIDLEAMTCRNTNTKIIVVFEKRGNEFLGKIKDIPDEFFIQWANIKNGDMILKIRLWKRKRFF